MFRCVEKGMPPDAQFPADLQKLGYFVNDTGHVRMIDYPDQSFQYRYSNIERYNEVRVEAMQKCWRREVDRRLSTLGIEKLYLPTLSYTKPASEPHIAVLAPPAHILKSRKRVIVIVNDTLQDLGILAYRMLQREAGLNGGSVINLAKELISRTSKLPEDFDLCKDGAGLKDKDQLTPGLIVMNNGQLLYSYKHNESMTLRSWTALPRKSICHDMIRIHETHNYVEGNRDSQEHIDFVWKNVINNPDFVAPGAEVYVIGIENGAENFVRMLDTSFDDYAPRPTALAVIQPYMRGCQVSNPKLQTLLHDRTRQWSLSDMSTDPLSCVGLPASDSADAETAYEAPLCPAFGGGQTTFGECIFTLPEVQDAVLNFFAEVAKEPSTYRNPSFKVVDPEAVPDEPGTDEVYYADGTCDDFNSSATYPNQSQIDAKKEDLAHMKAAMLATPDSPVLAKGKLALQKRIDAAEARLQELQKTLLAKQDARLGEDTKASEEWETTGTGPKVPFAGTMVDSDLLKGAGLLETIEELEEADIGDQA